MSESCNYLIYAGSRYVDPEPPEYCDNDALEGEEFCEEHSQYAYEYEDEPEELEWYEYD